MKPNVNVTIGGPQNPSEYTYKTVILKSNIPFVSQVNEENCIYVIKWDFDLKRQSVTIPANCVLKFEGGSLSNGTIVGQNTGIDARMAKIFNTDILLEGTWKVVEAYPEWFGAKVSDNINDTTIAVNNTLAIRKTLDYFSNVFFSNQNSSLYYLVTTVNENDTYVLSINRKTSLRGVGKEVTKIKYIGNSDIPVIYLPGSSSRDSNFSGFTIEGKTTESRVGIGIKVIYGSRKVSFEDIELYSLKEGINCETWRVTINRCNVTYCNKGFVLGGHALVTMYFITDCGVNDCDSGWELKLITYSTMLSCGCDRCGIAYSLNTCYDVSINNCGAENNRRIFKFEGCSQIFINNIFGYYLTDDGIITKDDVNNYISLKNSYLVSIENLRFKILIPSRITDGYNPSDFYFVKIDNLQGSNAGLIMKDWMDEGSYSIPYYNRVVIDNAGGKYYYRNRVYFILTSSVGDTPPAFDSAVHKGFKFYNTDAKKTIIWDGSSWTTEDGFTFAQNVGSTANRPKPINVEGGVLRRGVDEGFSYYDTDLMEEIYAGFINIAQTSIHWVTADGYTAGPHKGTSSEFPTRTTHGGVIYPEDIGYPYFCTTDNKMYYIKGFDSHDNVYWVDSDGFEYGTQIKSGRRNQVPAGSKIYIGYSYFCTNRSGDGVTDGLMIFYKGQDTTDPDNPVDVWVDALGRVVE